MNYYKLINGENFVGIATSLDFRTHQKKHNILLACDEEQAQYVEAADGSYYHADWMKPVTTDSIQYTGVELIAIDESEYNTLYEAIKSGEEIVVEPDTSSEEEPEPVDPVQETTLEYVRSAKVAEMSNTCNKVITAGFDVTLSDGVSHHFSLTTQDQLNLITLSTMVESGESSIPYHADGELCKFYSAADIGTVVSTATSFKTYHVSYFNALKAYIEALETIDEIAAITYGVAIPEAYQSEVLKVLIAQMGASDEGNS